MTTFTTGFMWGAGISLGLCVGLVAWVFLRTATNHLLGIDAQWVTTMEANRKSLELLERRNILTIDTNQILNEILDVMVGRYEAGDIDTAEEKEPIA